MLVRCLEEPISASIRPGMLLSTVHELLRELQILHAGSQVVGFEGALHGYRAAELIPKMVVLRQAVPIRVGQRIVRLTTSVVLIRHGLAIPRGKEATELLRRAEFQVSQLVVMMALVAIAEEHSIIPGLLAPRLLAQSLRG